LNNFGNSYKFVDLAIADLEQIACERLSRVVALLPLDAVAILFVSEKSKI
jgi:hypothetical protein